MLDFPNNSSDIVWMYDGNVQYFTPGHVPRFVFAAIILISGILFTVVLFFGQWFPRCSKWKLMKWTKNTYYNGFMDAYHAPFTPKHRYWVGLLLFSLIAHNLITALALDTSLPVLSAGSITVGLIVFKLQNYPVYKIRFNDLLETLFFLNLAILAYGTLYIGNINESQVIISNISMAVAFILFVVIVCYHCYEYMLKKVPVLQNSLKLRKRIPRVRKLERYEMENNETWTNADRCDPYTDGAMEEADPDRYITPPIIRPATRPDQLREPALDVLAPLTTEDYRPAPPPPQATADNAPKVTHTVIDVVKQ